MSQIISRQGMMLVDPITLTTSATDTGGWSLNVVAGAMLLVDSKTAAGSITINYYVKADDRLSATYLLVDKEGSPISQTVTATGHCFALPDELFAARYVLPVVSSGTAVVRCVLKG